MACKINAPSAQVCASCYTADSNLFSFAMPGLDLKNLPEREEDIDFSDIYAKHKVTIDEGLDTIVVVDGAPIVDENKEEKLLSVLKKLFTKGAGEIKDGGMWMPMSPNAEGKRESKG